MYCLGINKHLASRHKSFFKIFRFINNPKLMRGDFSSTSLFLALSPPPSLSLPLLCFKLKPFWYQYWHKSFINISHLHRIPYITLRFYAPSQWTSFSRINDITQRKKNNMPFHRNSNNCLGMDFHEKLCVMTAIFFFSNQFKQPFLMHI